MYSTLFGEKVELAYPVKRNGNYVNVVFRDRTTTMHPVDCLPNERPRKQKRSK